MSRKEVMKTTEEQNPERLTVRPTLAPAVDILENVEELLIVADVPGARNEDVDVRFEKSELQLTARSSWPAKSGKGTMDFDWARSFVLPGGVDAERIQAQLKNGVLTIRLPKHDSLKPRQISVRAG